MIFFSFKISILENFSFIGIEIVSPISTIVFMLLAFFNEISAFSFSTFSTTLNIFNAIIESFFLSYCISILFLT